jgi:hypothetical protein
MQLFKQICDTGQDEYTRSRWPRPAPKTGLSATSPVCPLAPTISAIFFAYLKRRECVGAFGTPHPLGQ